MPAMEVQSPEFKPQSQKKKKKKEESKTNENITQSFVFHHSS
jgi:hypothetical protein